ncbi:DUF563 domain-containing protein [Aeromonas veronii]
MKIKDSIFGFLKWLLALRLVKLNKDFVSNNKKLSNTFMSMRRDDNLWGRAEGLDSDEHAELYALFNSRYYLIYFELNNNDFSFRSNHLSDKYGRYYYEDGVDYIPALSRINVKKSVHLNGCCAYLSNTECQHYGHFIMFVLPLISIYNQYCEVKPDYYYLGDIQLSQFHYKLLQLAGIEKNKLITRPCTADKIVYASISQDFILKGKKYWDHDSYSYVRSLVKDLLFNNGNRKIYVSRGNVRWRRLVNEDQLINYLIRKGFDIITMDGLSLEEQIGVFSGAEIIVAGHGAALTNLLFCKEKTKVIEIFPYDYPDVTSYVIASYSQCEYYRSQGEKYDLNTKACYRDIKVDLDDVVSKLNRIGVL